MTKPLKLEGRVWVLERDGRLIDDIDTDMIYHNAHLAVTDVSKMGQFAFGNLRGFQDFAQNAKPGDIVLAGDNFGSGSSRQHAVDCFIALGVQAVLARSFGAIYKRNAINTGFAIIELPALPDGSVEQGDTVSIDLETGALSYGAGTFEGKPISSVARDIYLAGGLFEYARALKE
jgi:3-isopropylmalate/(R)-2-methylmalate dehydratase small subunit